MRELLTQEEQQEYLDIPHFNREGFTFITGITPSDVKWVSLVGKEVRMDVEGKVYKVKIVE